MCTVWLGFDFTSSCYRYSQVVCTANASFCMECKNHHFTATLLVTAEDVHGVPATSGQWRTVAMLGYKARKWEKRLNT